MMRTVIILALVASMARAQENFTFSGYVVEFAAANRMNEQLSRIIMSDQTLGMNILRVRLRPALSLWEGGRLGVEYEASADYRSSSSSLHQYGPRNSRQILDMTWTVAEREKWTIVHGVDRFHVRQEFNGGDMIVGRQRIAWGTGRVWNPTDLFNPLNPLVPSKVEKDGVDAAMAKFTFASFTDLSLVCNPQRGWHRVNAGARFRTNVAEFDLSVMAGAFDRRTVLGADFAGNLRDAGIRGEGIMAFPNDGAGSSVQSFIFGADYQFTTRWYGMVEYFHNGDGSQDRYGYDLVRLVSGEIIAVARNYVALNSSVLLHPLVTVSATVLRNLDDGSGTVHVTAAYALTEELALVAGVQVFHGGAFAEYWYYPDAGYVKLDWYF